MSRYKSRSLEKNAEMSSGTKTGTGTVPITRTIDYIGFLRNYHVIMVSLRCPDQGDRNGRFTVTFTENFYIKVKSGSDKNVINFIDKRKDYAYRHQIKF